MHKTGTRSHGRVTFVLGAEYSLRFGRIVVGVTLVENIEPCKKHGNKLWSWLEKLIPRYQLGPE
jgi:hypothetical protein